MPCHPDKRRVDGMMSHANAGGAWSLGRGIMLVTIAAVVLTGLAGPSYGQDEPLGPRALVDSADARRVHRIIEGWIAQGGPDMATAPEDEPIEVSGVSALFVTLRWSGVTRGRGQWVRPGLLEPAPEPDGAELGAAVDLVQAARQATQASLRQIRTLDGWEQVVPLLLVDLQIAGTLELIRIPAGASVSRWLPDYIPGQHGLLLAPPETAPEHAREPAASGNALAWVWPGEAVSHNLPPKMHMLKLARAAGLSNERSAGIGRRGGPPLYRFDAIHFVRPSRNDEVVQLVRGNELRHAKPFRMPDIESLGRRLAEHLAMRQLPNGKMVGTYHPTTRSFDPIDAPRRDQALAAYALGRWLKLHQSAAPTKKRPDAGFDKIRAAVANATDTLSQLNAKPASFDAKTAALTMMALIEAPRLADRKVQRDMLARKLLSLQNEDGSFNVKAYHKAPLTTSPQAPAQKKPQLSKAVQLLVLDALLKLHERRPGPELAQQIRSSYVHLTTGAGPPSIVTLPWLAQVTASMQRLDQDPQHPLNLNAATQSLSDICIGLLESQIKPAAHLPESQRPAPDLIGGFDLDERKRPTWAPPDADWRSAHAMMFLAIMLRQGESSGVSAADLIIGCSSAAQFLGQLTFDEPSCYYMMSQEYAVGAVRKKLVQNSVGVRPTAMALLAICAFEQSLQPR
jgi:hypothetical protein